MERGDIIDLVGPSGSGKSSLLTACARLNPHAHGTFVLDGVGSDEFSAQQWRRDVSYLPQTPILTGKDVAEAIRLPWTLAIRGKGGQGRAAAARRTHPHDPGRDGVRGHRPDAHAA